MEQNFQDRLNNFQLPPPEGVWNKIDRVLEAQEEKRLARKLFYFEIMPPAQAWQKLSFKLGMSNETAARKRPIKKYILYASIAASITLSIISVNLLTGNNNSGTEESLITTPKIPESSKNPAYSKTDSVDRKVEVIDSSNHLIATLIFPSKKSWFSRHKVRLKDIEERLIGSASSLEKFVPESASRNKEISYEDGLDRYMIYASDDGNAVRLPKKMYDNFACPSNDPSCKEKIKMLQQKMVQGSLASDFTGVLDLLSNMDDRK